MTTIAHSVKKKQNKNQENMLSFDKKKKLKTRNEKNTFTVNYLRNVP